MRAGEEGVRIGGVGGDDVLFRGGNMICMSRAELKWRLYTLAVDISEISETPSNGTNMLEFLIHFANERGTAGRNINGIMAVV